MPSSFFSNKRRQHDIAAIGIGYLYVSNYLILSNAVFERKLESDNKLNDMISCYSLCQSKYAQKLEIMNTVDSR